MIAECLDLEIIKIAKRGRDNGIKAIKAGQKMQRAVAAHGMATPSAEGRCGTGGVSGWRCSPRRSHARLVAQGTVLSRVSTRCGGLWTADWVMITSLSGKLCPIHVVGRQTGTSAMCVSTLKVDAPLGVRCG